MGKRRGKGGADLAGPALSIVIPAYNEGEGITSTLRGLYQEVKARPLEVLVVVDFEADTTLPVVRALEAEMPGLRPHLNDRGRGALNAIRSGFTAARSDNVLVTMADGSDDPADADAMLEKARAGAGVVSGSRYMRGGRQLGGPLLKRTLSRVAGLTLHWFGGVPTHDATNSYRLYSRRLLEAVEIESDGGFELGIELTVKAHELGMPVAEVPTTWRDRTAGESRFKLWAWLPRYLRWYLRGLGSRFRRPGQAGSRGR